MVGHLFHNIFRDVRVRNRAHTCAFLVELDHARLEETLDGVRSAIQSESSWQRTIGARMISSYARRPYFWVGLPGRRTTKSYRFRATSPW